MYLRKRPSHFVQHDRHLPEEVFPPDLSLKFLSNLLNNIATTSNVISDEGVTSIPGAMIASPSREEDPETDQNYIFDWTRDSGLTILEMTRLAKQIPWLDTLLLNYVTFVRTSFKTSQLLDQAKWKIDDTPYVNWTLQGDGPATRILALLQIEMHLPGRIDKDELDTILDAYLGWILMYYKNDTVNIWEEEYGRHFYTFAMNYAALSALASREGFENRTENITTALQDILDIRNDFIQNSSIKSNISSNLARGNDLNIDVIFALCNSDGFGQRLSTGAYLVTLEKIVTYFRNEYVINSGDAAKGFGVNIGRYPLDMYDGDMSDGDNQGHPWFISTLVFGTYLYKMVQEYIEYRLDIVINSVNAGFFQMLGFETAAGTIAFGTEGYQEALMRIIDAANKQVFSVRAHCDGAHLSEQYNRNTGFMKSVRDLSWSYKEFFTARHECALAYASIKRMHGQGVKAGTSVRAGKKKVPLL